MAATTDPRQLSPKVAAIAIVGVILAAVSAGLATVTPEMLEGLGAWAVPASVVLTALGGYGLAWWRTDPLRVDYFQQKAAHDAAEAEQAAAANFDAETAVTDADEYVGKHVADPELYGDGERGQ